MTKVKYKWDEERGFAMCSILYHDKSYVGIAQCHPDDDDFKSELVGSNLAYLRANIQLLQGIKNEKRIELKALKTLYGSLTPSPKFNPKSFEAKVLLNQIDIITEDIEFIKECIQQLRNQISRDIESSEQFYQGIRKNRKQREDALKEQNND